MAKPKGGLGRGLDALFEDNSQPESSTSELNWEEIKPDPTQPRKDFQEDSLNELASSIKEHGILQPLLVRPAGDGIYMIVAGERRWRAAKLAGLAKVPVVIKEMTDQEAMSNALIENLQREDLNPVEEAEGYKQLADATGMTQEQIARSVGKSRSSVTNSMRILSLPEEVIKLVKDGSLSSGHAKAILGIADNESRIAAAKTIAEKGLSVREAEKISQKASQQPSLPKQPKKKDPSAEEVELALRNALGVEVRVSGKNGKGTLTLNYYSNEQLYEFANKLGGNNK